MLYSFGCYISSPFPDILVMLAAVFKSLYTSQNGSTHCTSVQRRPRIHWWRSPVFPSPRGLQAPGEPGEIRREASARRPCARRGDVFARLLPPSLAPHLLPNSLRPRDERGHQRKIKCSGQKINQHRLQIYDLRHRRRVYQISRNIFGRRLVIPGSLGASGKMWA